MIIKQIFTEPETEVKWYFDSIEEIVIVVYIRNRLRRTFACACNTMSTSSTSRIGNRLIWLTSLKEIKFVIITEGFYQLQFAETTFSSGTCKVTGNANFDALELWWLLRERMKILE